MKRSPRAHFHASLLVLRIGLFRSRRVSSEIGTGVANLPNGFRQSQKILRCKNWYSISRTMPDYVTYRDKQMFARPRPSRQAPRLRRAAMQRWGAGAAEHPVNRVGNTNVRCSLL